MDKVLSILMEIRPEFDFTSATDFVESGFLDSYDMVILITELDSAFGISINGMDITPDNFKDLESIGNMLKKYGVKP